MSDTLQFVVPSRLVFKNAGEVLSDLHYDDIRINTHPSQETFQAPSDVRGGSARWQIFAKRLQGSSRAFRYEMALR